ncbi:MAG: hypothetical protein NTW25_12640 [Candidatus Kapabacteria bacterium]|nr:hypothetical protein [Candidatus Kapabacteria bacterium]
MKVNSILLDTSFFIRLLNVNDPLHTITKQSYKYFLNQNNILVCSTISIAEYCVIGSIKDLPLDNIQILSFNFNHSLRSSEFARIVFDSRKEKQIEINDRKIIPNDTKLFAQADSEKNITHYISSDLESLKIYKLLNQKANINFKFLELSSDLQVVLNEN